VDLLQQRPGLTLELDDLTRPEVLDLLREHLVEMAGTSPAESCHVLDVEGLLAPGMTVWTAWDAETLAGCCALKDLGDGHGEIKSMRTAESLRGRGVAATMLTHLLRVARERGSRRLSLETGSQDVFAPARRLYARYGFVAGPPFGSYRPDPNSVFMSREI
jgi:putative acetyltransferase